MEVRTLTSGLIALLAAGTGRPIGDSDVPPRSNDDDEVTPYAIVMKSPAPHPRQGDWHDPESERFQDYAVKVVGRTRLQAEWMSDKVNELIVKMGSSDFNTAWTDANVDILDRSTLTIGAIVRSGPDLFEGNDIYRIRIGRKQ